ncbi:unnamed protein product [Symbiodinium sp. CCMP2592]|nr:unnamed protein product [Symbiodinium sp. CCMP2592]
MSIHGLWRELETAAVYNVTASEVPNCWSVTLLDFPATNLRMFEIRETGQGKLLFDVFCPEEEEPYRLVMDNRLPTRIVWHCEGRNRRTWDKRVQLWSSLLVQLMCEFEGGSFQLVLRKLTGEVISKVAMDPATSWEEARMLMTPGLRDLLKKGRKLAFVSPLGDVLTRCDDERPIGAIVGCAELCDQQPGKKQRLQG